MNAITREAADPQPAPPQPRAGTAAPQDVAAASGTTAGPVVVLLLADIAPHARWWGWSRFVLGSLALRGVPGLRFSRQLGSGYEGGFGLRPSASRQGLFLEFDDEAAADAFCTSAHAEAYLERADELCLLKLRAFSSRGSWGGATLVPSASAPARGPIAALTRASIRPSRALTFWSHAPASQAALESAAGCQLAVGLGEAPLLRQATFSVWDSVDAMNAYARHGAHQAAIRASREGGYFSESMFVRFVPLLLQGTWKGHRFG